MEIKDRLILITGASSGIGAATARAMGARGGQVLLLARRAAALRRVADQIEAAGGWAQVHPVDLSIPDEVDATAKQLLATVGPPDVIVNNAGAGRWLTVPETEPEEAVKMMAVPYFAAFYVTRAFLPAMLTRNSGQIVNLTSPAAFVPWPGATGYTAARWAVRGFAKALRADLHHTSLTVTLLTVGLADSTYFEHNPGGERRIPSIARLFPLLKPEQVAATVVAAVEQDRETVTIPSLLRLGLWAHRLLPRLLDWLVIRTGWRPPSRAAQRQADNG